MTLQDLRARLRTEERTLFKKYSDRIGIVERWRPWFGGVALMGAMVAAIARAIEGGWGLGLTIGGGILAAIGGALVVLMDYKKLEISQEAKEAHALADEAISTAAAIEADRDQVKQAAETAAADAKTYDAKRVNRIEATRLMIENVEGALVTHADAATSADRMLKLAAARIRAAVDYRAGDFFTLTIFKRELREEAEGERMHPIARQWTDPGAADRGRNWAKGTGYTGVLWSLADANSKASVVEPDTALPGMRERYPVVNIDPAREARYRSVASFPITVGKEDAVWGAVTATSDRPGVFDHQGELARQSVETIRDIALAAGLLAELDTKPGTN